MVEKMIVNAVGNYVENDWQNPRTGEKKKIKSFGLVLQSGSDVFATEAQDEMAETLRDMNIKQDSHVLASLSFSASRTEKDGVVRYFQRVRIEKLVVL